MVEKMDKLDLIIKALDNIRDIAFDIPPPNVYTPQIVAEVIAATLEAKKLKYQSERSEIRQIERLLAESNEAMEKLPWKK